MGIINKLYVLFWGGGEEGERDRQLQRMGRSRELKGVKWCSKGHLVFSCSEIFAV